MNARDQFKAAYFLKMAEQGIAPEDTVPFIKRAIFDMLMPAAGLAVGGALAAPPVLGYHAGATLAKAQDSASEADVDDLKKQELIDEYRRVAENLRYKQRLSQRNKT